MSSVSFNQIPSDIRVPFTYFEFNSGGSTFDAESKAVLVGQKLSSGTATAGALTIVPEKAEDSLFGVNSMAALMVKVFKRNAPSKTPYVIALDDPVGASKATATITVTTSSATANETIFFSIHGVVISVPVISGETDEEIATKISAAINAKNGILFSSSVALNVVTLTALNGGTIMNDLRIKYLNGTLDITPTNSSGGTGAIDMDGVLDIIPEGQYYDWIGSGYADSISLGHYETYTNDTSGSWNPLDGSYGHVLTFDADSLGNLSTIGNGLNDSHLSFTGNPSTVTPEFFVPAALAAVCVSNLNEPPNLSKPLQYKELRGIEFDDEFITAERNTLYYDGIGSFSLSRTGAVLIDRILTTYQTNAAGSPDATYLDIQTMAQLMYAARYIKTRIQNIYSNSYLNDQVLVDLNNDIIHALVELQELAVIEDVEKTLESMILEIDSSDANRVNAYLPIDHVNQLRVFAANLTSFLNIGE